jgi:hypothetical protein
MLDNAQIVADLENGEWAFYYCEGFNQETIRQVFRDLQGKLFIRYPDYMLTPLGKDEPEILLGKVPTSLELTTRISKLEDEVKRLNSLLAANRLLTRAAIHNMLPSYDPGYQIAKIIEAEDGEEPND